MMKELKSDEPYEVAPGCPTISFDLEDESLMLAYSSFVSACFKGDRIELHFQEWRIEIEGKELDDLWRLLQMQDMRALRLSSQASDVRSGECRITKLITTNIVEK